MFGLDSTLCVEFVRIEVRPPNKAIKEHIPGHKPTRILEDEMKICYSIRQSQRYAIHSSINSLRMPLLFHYYKIIRCINCRS
jgi:hypothetical protein